jgi:iron complex transport system permease protein
MPVAIPLVVIAGGYLVLASKKMNVLALGKETTINLGLNHRREVMKVLFFVSVLMAVTTALVGPLTFLGFLVATLAYQLADTYDHRYIYPMSFLIGFVVLAGAYFIMKNLFYAQGVVGIIIEAVGGITFLIFILRKGRL